MTRQSQKQSACRGRFCHTGFIGSLHSLARLIVVASRNLDWSMHRQTEDANAMAAPVRVHALRLGVDRLMSASVPGG